MRQDDKTDVQLVFKLLIEPFILPELKTYLYRINKNEAFNRGVIYTFTRIFEGERLNDLIDSKENVNLASQENEEWAKSVSYTHLTLPTKRIV